MSERDGGRADCSSMMVRVGFSDVKDFDVYRVLVRTCFLEAGGRREGGHATVISSIKVHNAKIAFQIPDHISANTYRFHYLQANSSAVRIVPSRANRQSFTR